MPGDAVEVPRATLLQLVAAVRAGNAAQIVLGAQERVGAAISRIVPTA